MKKKIIVYGDRNNILAQIILKKGIETEVEVEVIEDWNELMKILSNLTAETIVLINKNEKDGMKIKEQNPDLTILMSHGGESQVD